MKLALSIAGLMILGAAVVCVLLACAGEQYGRRRERRNHANYSFLKRIVDEQTEDEREQNIDLAGRKPWQK
jgi:hypothetical protein